MAERDQPKDPRSEWLPGDGEESEPTKTGGTPEKSGTPELGLDEFKDRLDALDRRALELEQRALDAERRAEEAEVRAHEALARAERAERALGRRPEEAAPATGDPAFDEAAAAAEAAVRTAERRIAAAGDAVRNLTAPEQQAAPESEPESEPEPEADAGGGLDINQISFERLRELGLSVTQSARLLARRDALGRFRSFDELNDLTGFPRELLDQLKRRLSLGSEEPQD